jgi:7-cyano-7-deazaguanine reductase
MTLPEHSPLGKPSAYKTEYDASLLFPIPRQPKRAEIGLPEGARCPSSAWISGMPTRYRG